MVGSARNGQGGEVAVVAQATCLLRVGFARRFGTTPSTTPITNVKVQIDSGGCARNLSFTRRDLVIQAAERANPVCVSVVLH